MNRQKGSIHLSIADEWAEGVSFSVFAREWGLQIKKPPVRVAADLGFRGSRFWVLGVLGVLGIFDLSGVSVALATYQVPNTESLANCSVLAARLQPPSAAFVEWPSWCSACDRGALWSIGHRGLRCLHYWSNRLFATVEALSSEAITEHWPTSVKRFSYLILPLKASK
jgi:hypothetical protein